MIQYKCLNVKCIQQLNNLKLEMKMNQSNFKSSIKCDY